MYGVVRDETCFLGRVFHTNRKYVVRVDRDNN